MSESQNQRHKAYLISPLEDDSAYRVFIDNRKQVADILEEIIARYPPGSSLTIRQATFSISEEFLRRIWRIKKKSMARFILVIDRKALQKTRILWRFVSNVYDEVYLADSHAKILIVEPDAPASRPQSVITSQNLTRGNRFESTFITSEPSIFKALLNDFNNLIKFHSVPMHEILPLQDNPDPSELGKTPSLLESIEKLAGIFMPISDIAVIVEMDPSVLREAISTPGSPEAIAYARGKARSKAKIRAQEMELAKLGSPLGMQNVRDNLIDMEAEE